MAGSCHGLRWRMGSVSGRTGQTASASCALHRPASFCCGLRRSWGVLVERGGVEVLPAFLTRSGSSRSFCLVPACGPWHAVARSGTGSGGEPPPGGDDRGPSSTGLGSPAGIGFTAAGVQHGPRDRIIGWSVVARVANIGFIVFNHRFLRNNRKRIGTRHHRRRLVGAPAGSQR